MKIILLFITLFLVTSYAGVEVGYYGNVDYIPDPTSFSHSTQQDTPPGWSDDERLSLNDAKESIAPRAISDSLQQIHAVWKDNRRLHGRDEIHYRARIDSTWDTLTCISNLDTSHNSPWITVDAENNVHVVFLRWFGVPYAYYDLGYRKYDHSTGSWEPEERVTYYDSIGLSGRPRILCDTNDILYAFWLNERNAPVTIWYATNDGSGWSSKQRVTDVSDSPNGYYGVARAPDNTIHCVWQDYRSGTAELYHSYYRGGSWSPAQAVTANGFTSAYPRLSADSLSNIHLVYGGGSSLNEKIHYLIWDSASETWGPETKFPSQMAIPHVDIVVSQNDGDVHLSFHESISSHIEIMYKHYDTQSGQWEPNVQLTFNYPDIRLDPQICLDPDDYVHIVWWDERDGTGQEEIYYKTNKVVPGVDEDHDQLKNKLSFTAKPNPFSSRLTFSSSGYDDCNIIIYNANGRVVRILDNDFWNGKDLRGKECPPGIYFCVLKKEEIQPIVKVIKIW